MLGRPGWRRRIDRRKSDRRSTCILKVCFYFWIGIVALVLLAFVLLQTPAVQRWTLEKCDIIKHGKNNEEGMPLEYDRITGIFPVSFTMHELKFVDPVGRTVNLDRARVAFEVTSPLLAGEIRVSRMDVHQARMSPMLDETQLLGTRDASSIPPWPNAVLGLRIMSTTWEELLVESMNLTLRVEGEINIRPNAGDMTGSATFLQLDPDATRARQQAEERRVRRYQKKKNNNGKKSSSSSSSRSSSNRRKRRPAASASGAAVTLRLRGDSSVRRINIEGEAHDLSMSWRGARCSSPRTNFVADASWTAWELLSFPVLEEFPRDDFGLNVSVREIYCVPDETPQLNKRGQQIEPDMHPQQLFGDYAAYVPQEVDAFAMLDETRSLRVHRTSVRSSQYALTGSAFWEGALSYGAQLTVRHRTLHEAGSELRLDPRGGSVRLQSGTAFLFGRSVTLAAQFDYPKDGEAQLRYVQLDVGGEEALRGSFVVRTPRTMRRLGASRDVLVIEGSLSGSGGADFSLEMEADANFDQALHVSALLRDLALHDADGSRLGSAGVEATLTDFPFDAHGTLSATLTDLWTPRLDARIATLHAERSAPLYEAGATRRKRSEETPRTWSIMLQSEGGQKLRNMDASAELLLDERGVSASLHPSLAVYRALTAWTNETSSGSFEWESGSHTAAASLHTLDTNGTYGNVSLSVEGDWNVTRVQSEFRHSLDTLSDLQLVAQRFQGQTNGSLLVLQDATGNMHLISGSLSLRELALYESDSHHVPLVANASLEVRSTEEEEGEEQQRQQQKHQRSRDENKGWELLHLEAVLPTYDGSVRGSGSFGPPRLNDALVNVDVTLELTNVSYVHRGNVTLRGDIKMFIP